MSIVFSPLSPSLRIGVVRGGPSSEYEASLKTGAHVLQELAETHRPVDIFISRNGVWHMNGMERSPERILKHVDVIFNALHGAYGEDGKLQELLRHYGIPHTGSQKISSAIAMNKSLVKDQVARAGIKTPQHTVVRSGEDVSGRVRDIFQKLPRPVIIKPSSSGSSVGVVVARTAEEMVIGIENALQHGGSAVVEEYIAGREATCGVLDNFRGQETYVLPPVEVILPAGKTFLDFDAKYSGQSQIVCPSHFRPEVKEEIEHISKLVHETLGLSQYSRSDFIVTPRRGVYFLEVNTLPGLVPASPLSKSLEAVGVKTRDFIHHVLSLALHKK